MKAVKKAFAFYDKIMKRYDPIISKCIHDNIFAIAGQSAFFIVLSSVPLIAFCLSILQNLHISTVFIEQALQSVFADDFLMQIKDFLTETYQNTLGISFISIIVTLWSASQGIHAITNGLNRVYDAYENRMWIVLRIRAMVYTVIFFVLMSVSLVIVSLGSYLDDWIQPYVSSLPDIITAIFRLRYLLVFLILTFTFASIYRNLPCISKEQKKEYNFKYQLPGAILCTISWFAVALGISIYVKSFNGFSVYGVITGLAIVMFLLYFLMLLLMICAEINYVYHDTIKNFSVKRLVAAIKRKLKIKK
ncbi:MAG: YihY/virulence factor BrkB family protein [Ruminococcus sp.]